MKAQLQKSNCQQVNCLGGDQSKIDEVVYLTWGNAPQPLKEIFHEEKWRISEGKVMIMYWWVLDEQGSSGTLAVGSEPFTGICVGSYKRFSTSQSGIRIS